MNETQIIVISKDFRFTMDELIRLFIPNAGTTRNDLIKICRYLTRIKKLGSYGKKTQIVIDHIYCFFKQEYGLDYAELKNLNPEGIRSRLYNLDLSDLKRGCVILPNDVKEMFHFY